MKLMIASDIHGSAKWCRAMLDAFHKEGADRLLLLGALPRPAQRSARRVRAQTGHRHAQRRGGQAAVCARQL